MRRVVPPLPNPDHQRAPQASLDHLQLQDLQVVIPDFLDKVVHQDLIVMPGLEARAIPVPADLLDILDILDPLDSVILVLVLH